MRKKITSRVPTEAEITRKANPLIDTMEPTLLSIGFTVYAEQEDFICYVLRNNIHPGITMLDGYADGTWGYYDQGISLERSQPFKKESEVHEYLRGTVADNLLLVHKIKRFGELLAE